MTTSNIKEKIKKGKLYSMINNLIENQIQKFMAQYSYTRIRFIYIGWFALLAFPAFYFIWKYLFPQIYDNLSIRLVGMLLSFVFIIQDRLSSKIKTWMPLYTYIYAILAAPGHFTFMLIMNRGQVSWQIALICATVYLSLLFDSINTIIIFFIGTLGGIAAGCLFYSLSDIYHFYLPIIPVAVFSLSLGALLNHSDEHIRNQKRMMAAAAVGTSIAHEIRTPLLGITFSSEGVSSFLPDLIETYKWAAHNGHLKKQEKILSEKQLEGILIASRRIEKFAKNANRFIDIMLMNISDVRIEKSQFKKLSIYAIIESALATYPFKPDERKLVHFTKENDFFFLGSELLMIHVIYNLLKNALKAIASINNGAISIYLAQEDNKNILVVEDTGPGISSEQRPYIFERFYSGAANGQGVGIGLYFCRRVIESMDGTIIYESSYKGGARFKITLPQIDNLPFLEKPGSTGRARETN